MEHLTVFESQWYRGAVLNSFYFILSRNVAARFEINCTNVAARFQINCTNVLGLTCKGAAILEINRRTMKTNHTVSENRYGQIM